MFVIVRTGRGGRTKSAPRRSGRARPLIVCVLSQVPGRVVCLKMGRSVRGGWLQCGCCKYICRVSSSFRDSEAASCTN